MKELVIAFCLLTSFFVASSAVCIWDGEGFNHQWNDPLNWVGDQLPRAEDDVVLDNTVVAGSYDVYLPDGDVGITVVRLRLTPQSGQVIRMILPPGNTSLTAFRATGEGDAIILDDGAEMINSSGAMMSSTPVAVTGVGYFRINNGGRYVHRTARSATDNLISRLSSEPGTELGIFEFDVTVASYIISLSGRTFGSLVLNAATNNAMVSYRGSGGLPVLVRGDLHIRENVTFSLSLSSAFAINRDLVVAQTGTFNLQSTTNANKVNVAGDVSIDGSITETGTGLPVLALNGNSKQTVAINSLFNDVTISFDNASGIELSSPLLVGYRAELIQGNLQTGQHAALIFGPGAHWVRNTGIVEGPVAKQGSIDFKYPVGAGRIYAPISLTSGSAGSATDEVTVEYIRSNPRSNVGNDYDQSREFPIDHISSVEYWSIRQTGSASAKISIPVNAESFCSSLASSFVTHCVDGAPWTSNGSIVTEGPVSVGNFETGVLTTSDAVALPQFVSIGTGMSETLNPLPVSIESMVVNRVHDNVAEISWKTTGSLSDSVVFEIGFSNNDSSFRKLATILSTHSIDSYRYSGAVLKQGNNRFMLIAKQHGSIVYQSRVFNIEFRQLPEPPLIASIFPNPMSQNAILNITSSLYETMELVIFSSSGLLVKRIKVQTIPGNKLFPLSLKELAQGYYFLRGYTSSGQTNSVPFFRE